MTNGHCRSHSADLSGWPALTEGALLGILSSIRHAWHRSRRKPAVRHTEVLRRAATVLTCSADDFFPAAVDEVGRALGADLVYIGEFTNDCQITTVAVSRHGRTADNFSFAVEATAAGRVQETGESECCEDKALDRYPRDPAVASVGAQALMALPIRGGT